MSEPAVLRELTDDGIMILTLNRPDKMNALSAGIAQGMIDAAQETKRNDAVRVMVVTGAGRGFCAGADLSTGGPAMPAGGGKDSGRGRSAMVDKFGPGGVVEAMADADAWQRSGVAGFTDFLEARATLYRFGLARERAFADAVQAEARLELLIGGSLRGEGAP